MTRRAWVRQIMGMPISLHLRGSDLNGAAVEAAVSDVFGVFEEADQTFSTFRDDSEVNQIRRGELMLVDADPVVRQVHELCGQATDLTSGSFTAQLPDAQGVIGFDPTGIVKGWAAERAAAQLTAKLPDAFCLNVGGDVVLGGEDGLGWRVGIEDPRDRTRIAQVVTLAQGGVATSGAAARGAHLYDPVTETFVERPGSVTVVGPSLLWADVWATALFVGPRVLHDRFSAVAGDYRMISV